MKTLLKNLVLKNPLGKKLWYKYQDVSFSNSTDYWKNRYEKGANSGCGSYGELATFKANILNNFVAEQNVKTVVEFGSGDGNQLSLFDFPNYTGLDISPLVIKKCTQQHKDDKTKSFALYDAETFIPDKKI